MSGIIGGNKSGIVGQSGFYWIQYHQNVVHVDATYGGTGSTAWTFTLDAIRSPIGSLVFMDVTCTSGSTANGRWHFRVEQATTGIKASAIKGTTNGYSDGTWQLIAPIEEAGDRLFNVHSYVTEAGSTGHNYRTVKYLGYLYGKK